MIHLLKLLELAERIDKVRKKAGEQETQCRARSSVKDLVHQLADYPFSIRARKGPKVHSPKKGECFVVFVLRHHLKAITAHGDVTRNSLLHFSRGSRRSFPLDERLVKLCSHDRGSSAKSGKHISRVKKVGLRCETKYSCDSQDRGPFRGPITCQDAGVISHCDGLCWRYKYF